MRLVWLGVAMVNKSLCKDSNFRLLGVLDLNAFLKETEHCDISAEVRRSKIMFYESGACVKAKSL